MANETPSSNFVVRQLQYRVLRYKLKNDNIKELKKISFILKRFELLENFIVSKKYSPKISQNTKYHSKHDAKKGQRGLLIVLSVFCTKFLGSTYAVLS